MQKTRAVAYLFIFIFLCSACILPVWFALHPRNSEDNTNTYNSNSNSNGVNSKPNFIVFLADDMGYGDASSYGHPTIQTPNIDKLVDDGMKLKQHYTCPM